MTPQRLLCSVLLAACAVASPAAQQTPVQSDQEILIGLEQKWNEAFYRNDVSFISTLLADEFVATARALDRIYAGQ